MNILHGFWLPDTNNSFVQIGRFFIWIESDEVAAGKPKDNVHPQHLKNESCLRFLKQNLEISIADKTSSGYQILQLPTVQRKPLPAPEFNVEAIDETISLADWQVFCCHIPNPIKSINHIHFLSCYQAVNTRVGSDLLFWYYFSQSLKEIFYKDRFIPTLIAHKNGKNTELYRSWKIVSAQYEALIQQAVHQIPLACHSGYEPESLLRHFAEVSISDILDNALQDLPQVFLSKLQGDLLADILAPRRTIAPLPGAALAKVRAEMQTYAQWQQKLIGGNQASLAQLGFQLHPAPTVKSIIGYWNFSSAVAKTLRSL